MAMACLAECPGGEQEKYYVYVPDAESNVRHSAHRLFFFETFLAIGFFLELDSAFQMLESPAAILEKEKRKEGHSIARPHI